MHLIEKRRTSVYRSAVVLAATALLGTALIPATGASAARSGADFYDTLDLERPELSAVAAAVANSDYAAADQALEEFYAERETPVYTPVEGDSDAIPKAMEISAGLFTWDGGQERDYYDPETDTIDVDWDDPWDEYDDPPINAPASMNRFLFNQDLTTAYQALPADDPRRDELALAWMEISQDFIDDKGDEPIGNPPNNRLTEGIRLTNWLGAFSVFKSNSAVSAADKVAYLDYIRQMSTDIQRNIADHHGNNWYASLARALYLSAVYLPEFKDSSAWKFRALSAADHYVNRNMRTDGLTSEPSIHYQNYALARIAQIQRFGSLNSEEPFTDEELSFLELQAEAISAATMPDFTIPLFGDSTNAEIDMSGVETIADELGREDLKWVATDGTSGTKPSWESKLFPVSYATMRSGWGEDDQYLFIGNQDTPYAASHRHPDDLGVVAYAYGRPLVVDPGAYDYSDSDSAVWMRRTTEAHNTVEVGGEPQPPTTLDDPSARRALRWHTNDGFDFYTGSHDDYDPIVHERSVFSPTPGFWIVSDVLTGSPGSEDYRQLWHFPADADVNVDAETQAVEAGFGDLPGVVVAPVDSGATSTAIHDDGYLTDGYDNLFSNVEYASFSQSTSEEAAFDTVLYPGDAGAAPSIGTSRVDLDVPRSTATAMRLDLPGGKDGVYYLTHEASPAARGVGNLEFDGRLFYVETDADGELSRFSIAAGTELVDGETPLMTSAEPVNDLSVEYDGSRVLLSTGEPLQEDLAVHAPGVTDIVLNGSSVPFTTDGDTATISAPSLDPSDPPLVEDTFSDAHDQVRTWDFEDGQAGGWHGLPNGGSWSVTERDGDGVYQQTDPQQIEGMAMVEHSTTDVAVQATVERGRTGSSHYGYGIGLRTHDQGTHYLARIYRTPDGVSAQLSKLVGGNSTSLAEVPLSIDPAEPHTLRASISGDTLRLWVDGELVATGVDDHEVPGNGIPNGGVGLQAHRAEVAFDDISVEELTDANEWSASRGTFDDTDEGKLSMQASGLDRSRLDLARTVSWDDYLAQVTFQPNDWGESGEVGLAVRATKDTLGYRAVLADDGTGQFARIERFTGGSYATIEPTVIAETPVSFSTSEPLPVQVVVRGSTIELWLDGELLTSATDTVIGRGGVSISGSDVNADVTDFTVRELTPTP